MTKSILGGILAAISLLVIYGASASNRITSWVDGSRTSSGQPASAPGNQADNATLLALNSTEPTSDAIVDVSGMTTLEKAGTLPKRQTVGATSNLGGTPATTTTTDDTENEVVTPNPPAATPPTNTTGNTQSNPAPTPAPVRALW